MLLRPRFVLPPNASHRAVLLEHHRHHACVQALPRSKQSDGAAPHDGHAGAG